MNQNDVGYASTRFSFDKRRNTLWSVLAPYLQRRFEIRGNVLDVGCGYGDFIANIKAEKRWAIDRNNVLAAHLPQDVIFKAGEVKSLTECFEKNSFDVIFNSNLLEHLNRESVQRFFEDTFSLLKPGGRLITLMPNYRYAFAEYFDDYTHVTPLSHVAYCDWAVSCGYSVDFCHPKFMPYSIKSSRVPVLPILIKLWLILPFKWTGKQMLVVARKQ